MREVDKQQRAMGWCARIAAGGAAVVAGMFAGVVFSPDPRPLPVALLGTGSVFCTAVAGGTARQYRMLFGVSVWSRLP